jgi:hypothetical protein
VIVGPELDGRKAEAVGWSCRQARRYVCRPGGPTPTTVWLGGLPAVWWSWEPPPRFLSIDTHGSSKLSNLGGLSQQGCQRNRRRQRRNWRVRAVERGQRSEPAWLRAHPGLRYFEPEKPAPTQIARNVWDTTAAGTGDGVNYNSERNLAKRKLAPHRGCELYALRLTASRVIFRSTIIRKTAANSIEEWRCGCDGIVSRQILLLSL